MTKRTNILTLAGAVALLGAGAAIAADYTFDVPMDVKGLSAEFTFLEVSCSVYTAQRHVMGTQKERRDLAKGAYEGKVRVVVKVDDKRITSTLRPAKYSCAILSFYTKAGKKYGLTLADANAGPRFEPNLPADTNSKSLLYVEADLR